MKQYIIKGGTPLRGEVTIGGAKNAALGIIVAAIMADEPVKIENLPDVDDVRVLLDAIESIGAIVERLDSHTVRINGALINDVNVEEDAIRKIRGSYYLVGALLGKYKRRWWHCREDARLEVVPSTSISKDLSSWEPR